MKVIHEAWITRNKEVMMKNETLENLTNKFVTITSEKIRIKNIEEQK